MPELPEVEVTRRTLEPLLVGRRLRDVKTTAPSYFFLSHPDELQKRLRGRCVVVLERRGKYLVAHLDDDSKLLLHLGMSGQLFSQDAVSLRLLRATTRQVLTPEQQPRFEPDEHTHLCFRFEDGGPDVLFRDVRKFGKVLWLAPGASDTRLDKLGVDALAATGDQLFAATRKRKVAIKSLLLAQETICGIGNIYADEGLFLAGVRPTRRALRMSRSDCDRTVACIQSVLRRSIETGGSSISDYIKPDGSDGGYQDERKVYARKGEPCGVCDAIIKRIVIGQRSSHYCPNCQR